MGLSEVSRGVRQVGVETDDAHLRTERVDSVNRPPQRARVDPASPTCRSRGRPRLGIDQLARHDRFGAIPELCGKFRSRFVEQQLEQR